MNSSEDRLHSLLREGIAGDRNAYQAFLKELSTHLRAFFRRRLTQLPDEVEDLVQETLLAVHNKRQTYDPGQPLTAWIHAIAQYKLVDLLRRRNGREALHESLDEEIHLLEAADNLAMEARRDLVKLLEQLPERLRLPIQYVKLDGLSVVEAARLAGMSESAVKVGVHRGLKTLAALIRGET